MTRQDVVLAVHGGAGRLAKRHTAGPTRKRYERGVAEALRAGQQILLKGGTAVRAVAEAVRVLEDNELFNAGKGSALCDDGSVELSASIMNGRNLAVGAMVGLTRIRNPVLAARELMEHSHGLLFGETANQYAESKGLETADPSYFFTSRRFKQWKKLQGTDITALDHSETDEPQGTVGAVARDRRGSLAAATSTGGLVNQLAGRVGDSPVIGAGTWADNQTCAVSATGKGDAFARIAFARRVSDLIELAKLSPEEAGTLALTEIERVRGQGGCIIVDKSGQIAFPFNSAQMIRGWVKGNGPCHAAIELDDEVIVD